MKQGCLTAISHRTIMQPNNGGKWPHSVLHPPTNAGLQPHLATPNHYFKWHKAANQKDDDHSSLSTTLTEDGVERSHGALAKKNQRFTVRLLPSDTKRVFNNRFNIRTLFLTWSWSWQVLGTSVLNIWCVLSPWRIRHFSRCSSFLLCLCFDSVVGRFFLFPEQESSR